MAASTLLQPDSSYFFHQLARVRRGVLVLDYNDSIAALCSAHDYRYFHPSFVEILDSILTTTSTRVILLTTERIHDLLRKLGFERHPEIWDPQRLYLGHGSPGLEDKRRRSFAPGFLNSCAGEPIAWLAKCQGQYPASRSAWETLVRPEFYTQDRVFAGRPESLPHLLIEWLCACGGELC